ncbi:MAG: diguanylate cyclase [Aquihabitans sp.]
MTDEGGRIEGRSARSGDPMQRIDPRTLVIATTLVVATAVVAVAAVLSGMAARSSRSNHRIRVEIQAPLDRIDETLEANAAGEAQLQLAAATTGAARRRHLEASIAAGETTAKAWARYRSVALPIDGVPALAARYERDDERGKGAAADAILPILGSDQPAPLAADQVEAAARSEADLRALRDRYQQEQDATLLRMQDRAARAGREIRTGAFVCLLLIAGLGCWALRNAHRTVRLRRRRAKAAELDAFESSLVRGMELLDDEGQAWASAARALSVAVPSAAVAVSATDPAGTGLRTTAGAMSCRLDGADRCPAIKAGSPLSFTDSTALDACPHLVGGARCSATCLPISIAGRSAGVAQLTGGVGRPPVANRAVHVVVRRVGERITLMRAIARIERQASRDPLTGLINRRTLDREVEDLQATGSEYAVAFADLDHFKRLNDVHGHQAGDQALRAFAATLTDGLRGVDLACRWGGEEFVVVLPGCDAPEAAEAMERVRTLLRVVRSPESGPSVTMSVGVAVHRPGEAFAETVVRADGALATAKATGRDRVQVWAPPAPAHSWLRPTLPVLGTGRTVVEPA